MVELQPVTKYRQNDMVYFVGDGSIEKTTPENIYLDTKIMFLSCRIAEIEGSVQTSALRVTNILSSSPRVNKSMSLYVVNF